MFLCIFKNLSEKIDGTDTKIERSYLFVTTVYIGQIITKVEQVVDDYVTLIFT